jgi:Tfp pilus assembly protein PilO
VDKFNALPLQAKLLALIATLGVLFAGFYFVLLDDLEGQKAGAKGRVTKAQTDAKKLKTYGEPQRLEKLVEEEQKLRDRLEANKSMLPEKEKIADLTEVLERQADERGLNVKEREKLDAEMLDYVKRIPVRMKVEGTFPAIVSFIGALAQPGMRLMTVDDITLKAIPIKEFMPKGVRDVNVVAPRRGAAAGGADSAAQRAAVQQLLGQLDSYEEALKRATISATFTVSAYSFTGQLVPPDEKAKRRKNKRRRR